jgi:hypothetical protein
MGKKSRSYLCEKFRRSLKGVIGQVVVSPPFVLEDDACKDPLMLVSRDDVRVQMTELIPQKGVVHPVRMKSILDRKLYFLEDRKELRLLFHSGLYTL